MEMRTPRAGTPLDAPRPPGPAAKPDWALSRREAYAAWRTQTGLPPQRRWPWVVLLLLLAVAGALGWQYREALAPWLPGGAAVEARGGPEGASDGPPGDPEPPATVQINRSEWATVEPVTLQRTVRVIGTLAPVRRADLSSEASGRVGEVNARAGDRVAAGDVLVQVDVERLTLDLDLARSNADATRAQLALAEGQLERAQRLVDRGVGAASTLDEAQSNVEGLRANIAALDDQVAAAELTLSDATVTAPFDGVVSARSVEPGAVVSTGTPLLTIVDLSRMEMLASAPVSAGASIEPGQAVEVVVDGVEGRAFAGEVVRIAPVAIEGTRTLTVYVMLDNADGTLLGGMFATGRIVTAEATGAVAVPTAAIREDDEGPHVLVVEDGVLARRAVAAGEAWEGDLTQVTEGLAPGDTIVVAALPDLQAGPAVELVEF